MCETFGTRDEADKKLLGRGHAMASLDWSCPCLTVKFGRLMVDSVYTKHSLNVTQNNADVTSRRFCEGQDSEAAAAQVVIPPKLAVKLKQAHSNHRLVS